MQHCIHKLCRQEGILTAKMWKLSNFREHGQIVWAVTNNHNLSLRKQVAQAEWVSLQVELRTASHKKISLSEKHPPLPSKTKVHLQKVQQRDIPHLITLSSEGSDPPLAWCCDSVGNLTCLIVYPVVKLDFLEVKSSPFLKLLACDHFQLSLTSPNSLSL